MQGGGSATAAPFELYQNECKCTKTQKKRIWLFKSNTMVTAKWQGELIK